MTSIAFVVPEMLPVPPVQGGAVEAWVHEVSCELALRGFDVAVVSRPAQATPEPRRGADAVRYLGVPWSRIGRRWYERKRRWGPRHPLRPLVKVANVLEYAMGVRRALRELDPDIVYVHNDPYLDALLGSRPGRGRLLHMHNDHLIAPAAARRLLSRVISRCDRVLCVSDFVRDRARAAYPDQAERIQTIANAIDLARPALGMTEDDPARATRQEGELHCLFVGRLVPQKGVHVLLEAFARLHRRLPGARLTIAGSSFFANAPCTPYEEALRRAAQAMGDAVRFTGFLPPARLFDLYRQVDAVIVPSTWGEPFGLVVLEAMASGACVIASKVGGLPELVDDGRTGWLVAPNDAHALAEAMGQVAREPELRRRVRTAARLEVARRFPLARLVDEVCACVEAIAPPASTRQAAPLAGSGPGP